MPEPAGPTTQPPHVAPVVAVCGPGGTGASTVAMALAQGLAQGDRNRAGWWLRTVRGGDASAAAADVVLADLCLRADQAALHDARDIVPGVQELVEAHRLRRLDSRQVRALTFAVVERGYHLLLGVRRPTSWTTIRSRAFEASLDGLRAAFTMVVADVEPELETEDSTGSLDVEERAVMAQTALRAAGVVVVVGRPGVSGVHGLVRCLQALVDFGIDPGRLLPVCVAARRGSRWRAGYTRAVADLVDLPPDSAGLAGVVFAGSRGVDAAVHDGTALPAGVVRPLSRAVGAVLARRPPAPAAPPEPQPVRPGSLGLAERSAPGTGSAA